MASKVHEIEERAVSCPHCLAGDPSVWDHVLSHYAHPAGSKLKMCAEPWRERCRRCSAGIEHGATCSQPHEMGLP